MKVIMAKFTNLSSIMFLSRVYISNFLGVTNPNAFLIKGILILLVPLDESPIYSAGTSGAFTKK